jgi:hypothetical protein
MQSESQFGLNPFIRVELRGESAARENGFAPSQGTSSASDDVTLDQNTVERDRLIRAWSYIYTHGCKSARSSY